MVDQQEQVRLPDPLQPLEQKEPRRRPLLSEPLIQDIDDATDVRGRICQRKEQIGLGLELAAPGVGEVGQVDDTFDSLVREHFGPRRQEVHEAHRARPPGRIGNVTSSKC